MEKPMKNKIKNISLIAIFLLIITACGAKSEEDKSKEESKGKIEIEYYSEEELERIYDLLMTIPRGE